MGSEIIYTTYDINLRRFLTEHGHRYILFGKNVNSNDMFWVFERNEDLNQLVKQWFDNKR